MEATFPGYYTSAFPKEYVPKLSFLKGGVGSQGGPHIHSVGRGAMWIF